MRSKARRRILNRYSIYSREAIVAIRTKFWALIFPIRVNKGTRRGNCSLRHRGHEFQDQALNEDATRDRVRIQQKRNPDSSKTRVASFWGTKFGFV